MMIGEVREVGARQSVLRQLCPRFPYRVDGGVCRKALTRRDLKMKMGNEK